MTDSTTEQRKYVVVIGLSAAGSHLVNQLEKALPKTHRLVGINREEYIFLTIAALRASILPNWQQHCTIPLDKLFKQPESVLLAGTTVTKITPTHVVVDKEHSDQGFSHEIPYDILVLATGASYNFPARPSSGIITPDETHRRFVESQALVRKATSVLVVGDELALLPDQLGLTPSEGGAVGVEYCGEVTHAYPDMKVTLVHAHDRLHSSLFTEGFHKGLLKRLKDRNVDVRLNTRAKIPEGVDGLVENQTFHLDHGSTVAADFVLNATGNKPNSGLIQTLAPDAVLNDGHISVKQTMQIDTMDPSLSRVFAIGDCTKTKNIVEWKSAFNGQAQAALAAKNIIALINDKPLGLFKKQPIFGVIAMGPHDGLFQLPFGIVLGGWAAKRVKSTKMFVPFVWPTLNAEYANVWPNERPPPR